MAFMMSFIHDVIHDVINVVMHDVVYDVINVVMHDVIYDVFDDVICDVIYDVRAVSLSNITMILIQFNIKIDWVYPRDRDLILMAIVHGIGIGTSVNRERSMRWYTPMLLSFFPLARDL